MVKKNSSWSTNLAMPRCKNKMPGCKHSSMAWISSSILLWEIATGWHTLPRNLDLPCHAKSFRWFCSLITQMAVSFFLHDSNLTKCKVLPLHQIKNVWDLFATQIVKWVLKEAMAHSKAKVHIPNQQCKNNCLDSGFKCEVNSQFKKNTPWKGAA